MIHFVGDFLLYLSLKIFELKCLFASVSDITILLVMAVGLFVVDPRTAVGAIIMFGLVGYVSYQLMHKRAKALGELNSRLQVESQEKIIEVLTSYRELTVSNRKGYYANVISNIRQNVSSANAEMVFMPKHWQKKSNFNLDLGSHSQDSTRSEVPH